MRVTILGAGKVGRSLASALRAHGHGVVLRARRRSLPRAPVASPLLVLATRDGDVGSVAAELARRRLISRRTAVVYTAGGVPLEELDPLRGLAAGVGQAHPLLSFADAAAPPRWTGAHLLVRGDAVAVRRARAVGRALGMIPRAWEVDLALYHAAAALLANGAAALASISADLLVSAGAPPRDVARALGPLLVSVGENVARLGLPWALTGPVRRGDVRTVTRHVEALRRVSPGALAAYLAMGRAQLPLARALGDASPPDLARLARAFAERPATRARRRP